LSEWGEDGRHLVPLKDDIEKFAPTALFNLNQKQKREVLDYDGNKFPIHRSRDLKNDDLDEIEEDLEKWLCDFKEKLVKHKTLLFRDPQHRRFNLEFGLVSPLYYRLQHHLIDWGIRSHHPDLDQVAAYYDSIGAKFDDKPVREVNVLTYEVTREEEEEARIREMEEEEAREAKAMKEEGEKEEALNEEGEKAMAFLLAKRVNKDGNLQCIPM